MCSIILGFALIRASRIPEVDVLWAARNGKDILNGGSITQPNDVWNFLTLGEQWSPNSWLWNVITALFANFGDIGFWILVLISNIIILGLFWLFLVQLKTPLFWQPILLILLAVTSIYFTNGRSNTSDFIVFLLFLNISQWATRLSKTNYVLTTILASLILSSLWVNLHFTGILCVFLFALSTWVLASKTFKTIEKIFLAAIVGTFSFIGTLITPFGIKVYEKALLVQDESVDLITEWGAVIQPGEILWLHIFIILLGFAAAGILFFKNKIFLLPISIVSLSVLTVFTSRYALFVILLLILASAALLFQTPSQRKVLIIGARMVSGTFLLCGIVLTILLYLNPDSIYPVPVKDFNAIPDGARVLTTQHSGSELIYYRPDVLVSMDGRNDLIGKERMVQVYELFQVEDEEYVQSWLDTNKVDVVFLDAEQLKNSRVMVDNLESLGWEPTSSGSSLVFIRP